MNDFFIDSEWKSFWISIVSGSVFFLLSIPLAIWLIPYFTLRQLNKKNKKYIVKKQSSIIQELCEYVNESSFLNNEFNKYQVSIFTNKKYFKNYQFVAILFIDVFSEITLLKFQSFILNSFQQKEPEKAFEVLKLEKSKLEILREKLENIIGIHSLHIDDKIISDVSDLCLEIRSFEIMFEYNNAIDDLIKSGESKRLSVVGVIELRKLNEIILKLLKKLLTNKNFETEMNKTSR